MTLRDLSNAAKGYGDRQEILIRALWEQTRWEGAVIVNSNPFSKKKFSPRDLIKFPWEKKEKDFKDNIELIKERRKWRTR